MHCEREILSLESLGSWGSALGTQITAPTKLFPSLQLWYLKVFWSMNLRLHQHTVIFFQNQLFLRGIQEKCCYGIPNSIKTINAKVLWLVAVKTGGCQSLGLTLRMISVAVTDLYLQLPFLYSMLYTLKVCWPLWSFHQFSVCIQYFICNGKNKSPEKLLQWCMWHP